MAPKTMALKTKTEVTQLHRLAVFLVIIAGLSIFYIELSRLETPMSMLKSYVKTPAGLFYGVQYKLAVGTYLTYGVYEYNITFDGIPSSLKISGTAYGDGGVSVSIINGSQEILVYKKEGIKSPKSSILEEQPSYINAGLTYASGSPWDANDNGFTFDNGVIDYTVNDDGIDGQLDVHHLCTEWMVYSNETQKLTRTCVGDTACCNAVGFTGIPGSSWNETFHLYRGKLGAAENNVVGVQVHYININLSLANLKRDVNASNLLALPAVFKNLTEEFKEACTDSCTMTPNTPTLTLRIEIYGDAALQLNEIEYATDQDTALSSRQSSQTTTAETTTLETATSHSQSSQTTEEETTTVEKATSQRQSSQTTEEETTTLEKATSRPETTQP